jgi:hypothetical protein
MLQSSKVLLIFLCYIISICAAEASVRRRGVKEGTIPEFFDDSLNIYALIVGLGIILLCGLVAFLIFKLKSRSAAFENSLFQNL